MVGFYVYDLSFLVLFTLFIVWFLYSRRKNLKREGIIYLYKTKIGMKFIDYVGGKYGKILNKLKYVILGLGYVLMAGILYLIGQAVYIYLKFPAQITEITKAPPIAPLIPYFPKLFGFESFLPPFYFVYFLLALAVVAIVHEFAHGIYMKLFKVRIKSTGFVFLGPILGAFVEQDDKDFHKKKNVEQMTILGAGVFANVVFALMFFGLMVGFFYVGFQPAGYEFNSYAYSIIPINLISGFGSEFSNGKVNLTEVNVGEKVYFIKSNLKSQLDGEGSHVVVYDDAPAVKQGLDGVIVEVDGMNVLNQGDLQNILADKKPGDVIEVRTFMKDTGEEGSFSLELEEHPRDSSRGYMGIAFIGGQGRGFIGKFGVLFTKFKDPSTYYEPKWDGGSVYFIYNLLYWVALINFFVALFNMLPLGMLDGGRFFYLTVLSLTKSKKVAKGASKGVAYLILLLFVLLVLGWVLALL